MNAPGDAGMRIYAPDAGTVDIVSSGGSWGRSIRWTRPDGGEKIHFAHLSEFGRTGRVEAGDPIGRIGMTGRADSPHLHASAWRSGPARLIFGGSVIEAGRCYSSRGSRPPTPPVTLRSSRPTEPSRDAWTRGAWVVRLRCTDDWAGCSRTEYLIDDGGMSRYAEPLALRHEGKTWLRFRSVDADGHAEVWRRVAYLIDRTAPRVKMREVDPQDAGYVDLRATSFDLPPTSGIPVSGSHGVTFVVCADETGSCRTFPGERNGADWTARPRLTPGPHTVRAVAEDVARNKRTTAASSFDVGGSAIS